MLPDPNTLLKLCKAFEDLPTKEHSDRWAALWDDKFTPWDRGMPSMALNDLLTDNPNGVIPLPNEDSKKTTLVPGCGKGYDVLLLSYFGYNVVGLEYAPTAIEQAKEIFEKAQTEDLCNTALPRKRGDISWICQDFFAEGEVDARGPFDLIFDFTFFCALPPSMRPGWASRIKNLLSPGGRLICLEFPTEKASSEAGPPWAAHPEDYLGYLANPGAQPQTDEHGGVVGDQLGPVAPGGLKRLAHVKPRRTHTIGTDSDGRVMDFISVWGHADE
ncbi:S-adenosyl-L-methionine-dependent methyltransferase [Xylaria palmicola]|nr:S-adenosyl-L-methionine-dependent methyltransferase [Xylaria palmicola]